MNEAGSRLEELSETECRRLLGHGAYLGRIGFIRGGRPVILPVNYLFDDEAIVFRTAAGTWVSTLEGEAVAFEVDTNTPLTQAGWSVLVQGTVEQITDPETLDRLARGPLQSWAWRGANEWFRINVETLSGRRIPEG